LLDNQTYPIREGKLNIRLGKKCGMILKVMGEE